VNLPRTIFLRNHFLAVFVVSWRKILLYESIKTVVRYQLEIITTRTFTIEVEKLPDCRLLRGKEQCGHVIVLSVLTKVRLGVIPASAAL